MAQFSNVSSSRGAPMGRTSYGQPTGKAQLFKVNMVDGGYDDGGAYWGSGTPLYCLRSEDCERFLRAESRYQAFKFFQFEFEDLVLSRPERQPMRFL